MMRKQKWSNSQNKTGVFRDKFLNYFDFSHTFTSIRLIIKNLEFLTYLSHTASSMHYYDIYLLHFSQIEFELSAK